MSERLDQIDQANEFAAGWTDANVSAIRGKVPETREEPEEEPTCSCCSATMSSKRWSAGYDTCIDCARWQEEIDNRRRKTRWED